MISMIKLIILIVLLTPKEIKSNDEYMQSSDSYMSQQSCSCPPLKPIIKYIAVEVPKIVQVPSPAPPPIPMPPQPMKPRTKFIGKFSWIPINPWVNLALRLWIGLVISLVKLFFSLIRN